MSSRSAFCYFAESWRETLGKEGGYSNHRDDPGGTTPTIGNGTLTAVVTRHGAMISVTYNLAIGSTTNLGTGELRFSLPTTPVATGSGITQHVGTCVCYDSSGNTRVYGHIAVTPGVAYATCATETDVVFVNGPFVWATGDWLRATITYPA